jgi:hypothetical protein
MLEFSNSSRPASSRGGGGGGGGARAFDRKMLVLSIFRGFRSLPKKKNQMLLLVDKGSRLGEKEILCEASRWEHACSMHNKQELLIEYHQR